VTSRIPGWLPHLLRSAPRLVVELHFQELLQDTDEVVYTNRDLKIQILSAISILGPKRWRSLALKTGAYLDTTIFLFKWLALHPRWLIALPATDKNASECSLDWIGYIFTNASFGEVVSQFEHFLVILFNNTQSMIFHDVFIRFIHLSIIYWHWLFCLRYPLQHSEVPSEQLVPLGRQISAF
jgi:hypothetical protein